MAYGRVDEPENRIVIDLLISCDHLRARPERGTRPLHPVYALDLFACPQTFSAAPSPLKFKLAQWLYAPAESRRATSRAALFNGSSKLEKRVSERPARRATSANDARCSASKPRSAYRSAKSPASRLTAAVTSSVKKAGHCSSKFRLAAANFAALRSRLRRSRASAARASGYATIEVDTTAA